MTSPADFSAPKRVIKMAMQDAGLLQEGDDPSSEQYADNSNRLNDMLNFWATQGLKLWTELDQAITLVAGTQTYSLGPAGSIITTRPMRVLQGYYLDADDNRRSIEPLSWDEWLTLSQTTQQGPVTQYFVDKQQTDLVVKFWLVPDTTAATGTVHLMIQRQIDNFTGLDDTINLPKEWIMAVRWGLADELCSGQPQSVQDRCSAKALTFRSMVEDWDCEDTSTRFQPNSQSGGSYSNRGFV